MTGKRSGGQGAVIASKILAVARAVSISRYLEFGDAHKKQHGPHKVVAYENLKTNYFKLNQYGLLQGLRKSCLRCAETVGRMPSS